jgi:hypothetical protein
LSQPWLPLQCQVIMETFYQWKRLVYSSLEITRL